MPEKHKKHSVLIVDDDQSIILLMQKFLKRQGIEEIETASNGQVASDIIRSKRFDFVISDLDMPVMDGFQLLAYIRTNFRDMKIMIMTGNKLDEKDIIRKGALDVVLKPFNGQELMLKLENIKNEKRKSRRFFCENLNCRLKDKTKNITGKGTLKNISLDGALVQSEAEFNQTDNLDITIFSKYSGDKLCEASGEVTRIKKERSSFIYNIAIYFDAGRNIDFLGNLESFIHLAEK